jgi:hypothetical protein
MFTFLTPTPEAVFSKNMPPKKASITPLRSMPSLLAATLTGALLLAGCQQQSAPTADPKTSEQAAAEAEANKPAPQSDSAAARIAEFQPLYVAQMQGLQRRLQAEYESLLAADTPSNNQSLLEGGEDTDSDAITDVDVTTDSDATTDIEINTSTEVGERDLEVLKRISLEPREPKVLTDEQIIERYQQAVQALYEPAATALDDEETDTLLNIATLSPQLFEHPEIAKRVSVKSPALARFIVQQQVGQQIEAQQALDMQQMKVAQQQEFEGLMTKFDETIKGYDEQIAKYEQTLKEFSDNPK